MNFECYLQDQCSIANGADIPVLCRHRRNRLSQARLIAFDMHPRSFIASMLLHRCETAFMSPQHLSCSIDPPPAALLE